MPANSVKEEIVTGEDKLHTVNYKFSGEPLWNMGTEFLDVVVYGFQTKAVLDVSIEADYIDRIDFTVKVCCLR